MVDLGKNEHKVLELERHWFFFFWPIFWLVIFSIVVLSDDVNDAGDFLIPAIFLLWLVYRVLVYYTDEFLITNTKIHLSHGIISKNAVSVPLDKVNNIIYHQGVIGRMVGYGTVTIQSAALSGAYGFKYIPDPAKVKSVIENSLEDKHDNQDKRLAGYIGDAVKK